MFLLVHRFELIYIFLLFCIGDRARTCDILVPNQELYQLSYTYILDAPVRFELAMTGPKPVVLPLHQGAFLFIYDFLSFFCFDDAKVRIIFELPKLFRAFNIVLTF